MQTRERLEVFSYNILIGRPKRNCSGDQIEKNEMGWACSTYGGRGVLGVWVEKPEGKRPLVRTRRRWNDNIKMKIQEV